MSGREWQPGDVAMVRLDDETEVQVVVQNDGFLRSASGCYYDPILPTRRLAVIDPEDRAQVERLCNLWFGDGDPAGEASVTEMQVALREFTNPTPPKPEEPTGLGAVVEDAEGKKWVRTADTDCNRAWSYANNYADAAWSQIDVVRVLSEGVTE